ncbi:MAG: hypothetical protein ACRYFK_20680 [Janthinobacterium lividum]
MKSSRSQNPFGLVLLVVGLLGGVSLLKPGLTVGGQALRPVRLLADVLRPAAPGPAAAPAGLAPPPPNGPAGPGAARPTGAALALGAAAPDQAVEADTVPNLGGLDSFLAALRQAKADGRKVRIAYFGDSMIEGDLLTGDLRQDLQQVFGGAGVGFVPANYVAADFRETIHQTFSPDWHEYNLVTPQLPAEYPLGISGHVFLPEVVPPAADSAAASGSWMDFRAGAVFPGTRRLPEARLFYGPGAPGAAVLVTTGTHAVRHALEGTAAVNELVLRPGAPARRMRFDFTTQGPRPVYGVSFESADGVTLDNFSFRGNSGMSLTRIPYRQLAAFGKLRDYRLIVLHYGVNVANASVQNYTFYVRAMTRAIDRLQRACPRASVLIVGMSDKSARLDGEFVTDPSVPRLVAAQLRLARRNHAAFWNLFRAMGGANSMVSWVDSSPPLANHDYTHVNGRGARRMASLLDAFLMAQYAQFGAGPTPADTPSPAPSPILTAPAPTHPDSAGPPTAALR